jgi:pimeloyl-ACP methyl ester carboxylesterase
MERGILNTSAGAIPYLHGGGGEPVIILHRDTGWHGSTEFHEMLARDFKVIALSIPGFNGADLPKAVRDVFHLSALVGQAIDALSWRAPVSLVGLGFGGWVAASIAAMSPGRAARLALVSPMGIKPARGEILDQFLITPEKYVRMSFGDTGLFESFYPERDIDVQERWDRNREATTRVAWKPIGHDPQLPPLLSGIRVPALVVWGDADLTVPPSCAEQWAALLPDCRTASLPGGHYLELQQPAALTAMLAGFLSSTATPEAALVRE